MKILNIEQIVAYIIRQSSPTDSIHIVNERGESMSHIKGYAFEIVPSDSEVTPLEQQLIDDDILEPDEGLKDIEVYNLTVVEDDIITTQYDDIIIIDTNDDEAVDRGDILFIIK